VHSLHDFLQRVHHKRPGLHDGFGLGLPATTMTRAVVVRHAASQHVGDGLQTPVRVVGKATDVVAGVVGARQVEHQKRVQALLQIGAVKGGLPMQHLFDLARGASRFQFRYEPGAA
jgi:hypothetical protein